MPIIKLKLTTEGKVLLVDGQPTTNESCCCDPCELGLNPTVVLAGLVLCGLCFEDPAIPGYSFKFTDVTVNGSVGVTSDSPLGPWVHLHYGSWTGNWYSDTHCTEEAFIREYSGTFNLYLSCEDGAQYLIVEIDGAGTGSLPTPAIAAFQYVGGDPSIGAFSLDGVVYSPTLTAGIYTWPPVTGWTLTGGGGAGDSTATYIAGGTGHTTSLGDNVDLLSFTDGNDGRPSLGAAFIGASEARGTMFNETECNDIDYYAVTSGGTADIIPDED